MADSLPKFDNPPVVETAVSSQFARLATFRTAHAGCFWLTNLSQEWRNIQETVRLDDQFERFGDERKWGQPGFRFFTSPEVQRTQISNPDGTRMIQLQDSRFIYNWKKTENKYPSFAKTKSEFSRYYLEFKQFVEKLELGKIEENQWEVTYINHLPKGDLWNTPQEWVKIFPWLAFPPIIHAEPEYLVCEWASKIGDNRGRLHANLSFARINSEGPESLILSLIARGAVSSEGITSVEEGFQIGHEVIVRSFAEMTSEFAHKRWERTA
jgi:uncharacterized protein (TIGR04255 family)